MNCLANNIFTNKAFGYLAIVLYITFIFYSDMIPKNLFVLGDIFVGLYLLSTITTKKSNKNVLTTISLVWLVSNYIIKLSNTRDSWYAYDGFAIASILNILLN